MRIDSAAGCAMLPEASLRPEASNEHPAIAAVRREHASWRAPGAALTDRRPVRATEVGDRAAPGRRRGSDQRRGRRRRLDADGRRRSASRGRRRRRRPGRLPRSPSRRPRGPSQGASACRPRTSPRATGTRRRRRVPRGHLRVHRQRPRRPAASASYDELPAAVLTETYVAAATQRRAPLPDLLDATRRSPTTSSYSDTEFCARQLRHAHAPTAPSSSSTTAANAFILSAASDFMNAATAERASGALSSGIDPAVASLPAGFAHRTRARRAARDRRGLRDLGRACSWACRARSASRTTPRPTSSASATGPTTAPYYYYNYDTTKGYPATLAGRARLLHAARRSARVHAARQLVVPQGPAAARGTTRRTGSTRTPPTRPCCRTGSRRSSSRSGCRSSRTRAGSTRRARTGPQYTMSNNVSIDPAYWASDRQLHRRARGVAVYEQDWLNQNALPETTNLTDQDAFMDDMASADGAKGHRHAVLHAAAAPLPAGLEVPEPDDDARERRPLQQPALRGLPLRVAAHELSRRVALERHVQQHRDGQPPAVDAVGGHGRRGRRDRHGERDQPRCRRCAPTASSSSPTSRSCPSTRRSSTRRAAVDAPLVAATVHRLRRALARVVRLRVQRGAERRRRRSRPRRSGYTGQVFVYNYFQGTGAVVDAAATYTEDLADGSSYYVVVPVGPSGIAFLGDAGQVRVARQEAHLPARPTTARSRSRWRSRPARRA